MRGSCATSGGSTAARRARKTRGSRATAAPIPIRSRRSRWPSSCRRCATATASRRSGTGRERNRAALVIDFTSVDRTGQSGIDRRRARPRRLLRLERTARDWRAGYRVDAETYDVLRIDRGVPGPDRRARAGPACSAASNFDGLRHPRPRRGDDADSRPVTFTDPDEVLLLRKQ